MKGQGEVEGQEVEVVVIHQAEVKGQEVEVVIHQKVKQVVKQAGVR